MLFSPMHTGSTLAANDPAGGIGCRLSRIRENPKTIDPEYQLQHIDGWCTIQISLYIYIYIYIHINKHVYMYIYIYIYMCIKCLNHPVPRLYRCRACRESILSLADHLERASSAGVGREFTKGRLVKGGLAITI